MKNIPIFLAKSIVCFAFCLLSQMVMAQNKTAKSIISGKIVHENEKAARLPLVGATVVWAEMPAHGTVADTAGYFQISRPNAMHKTLIISFIGFKSDTIKISSQADEVLQDIVLVANNELNAVEVTFRPPSVIDSELSALKTQTITKKELAKAACCNLSESFETNPSVDVAFTDAITGTKQIEMLGLAGIYTQITTENMPSIRGLASNFGLNYLSGSWIQNIAVSKGVGSVVNGYESIAGQINVEMKNPESTLKEKEHFFFNAYANEAGRMEGNINFTNNLTPLKKPVILPNGKTQAATPRNTTWATTTLLHASSLPFQQDHNHDGFMDMPTYTQLNGVNRWSFTTKKGWEGQFGIKLLRDDKLGGQADGHNSLTHDMNTHTDVKQPLYRFGMDTRRVELWSKTGFVWQEKPYKSTGLQLSAINHEADSYFGTTKYKAKQQTLYANWIFQSIVFNTDHTWKIGMSQLIDKYDENFAGKLRNFNVVGSDSISFGQNNFQRTESVTGSFVEYQYAYHTKFSLVAGLRADVHNYFGLFFTPRLHLRYAPTENTTLRASFGRGQRTANIFAENTPIFASSRVINVVGQQKADRIYGLSPEVAWNFGLNLTQKFILFYREGSISADFYRTDFENQIVADLDKNPKEIWFYNLQGKSYSNSMQVEVSYELLKNLDIKAAYRWLDVQTTFHGNLLQKPLTSQNRFFVNAAYETENKWKFDLTLQWYDQKRLPKTDSSPEELRQRAYSPNFFVLNGQVSKTFKNKFEVYLGGENLLNFTQANPIVSADNPYNPYFDSSFVWGNIFGRMVYAGVRMKF
jgi:outer membrane receptor for ferrienterochelin and colicins